MQFFFKKNLEKKLRKFNKREKGKGEEYVLGDREKKA